MNAARAVAKLRVTPRTLSYNAFARLPAAALQRPGHLEFASVTVPASLTETARKPEGESRPPMNGPSAPRRLGLATSTRAIPTIQVVAQLLGARPRQIIYIYVAGLERAGPSRRRRRPDEDSRPSRGKSRRADEFKPRYVLSC